MVAKITTPKSAKAALNYNEQKVHKGNAEFLYAGNCLREAGEMNFYEKLEVLESLNSLNKRAATNTLHVPLNFSPGENFSDNKLASIASAYMDKIGFKEQPFLVYRHEDAGHPHIHIVSTTIRQDGSRINTHNIGKNQSEKARKEIELEYNLVKAQAQQESLRESIKPIILEKVMYGNAETKRSITNIVSAVYSQYKYCSLPEFNAALKQFNVTADRGKEEGRIFKNRGLVYRIMDAKGNKVGVPIKASSIASKPTLENLEKKFASNEVLKMPLKQLVKALIEECLKKPITNLKSLQAALEQKQVYMLLRQNEEGRMYGVTFVDNKNKCVFNGSDLGKGYSVAGLQARLTGNENKKQLAEKTEVKPEHNFIKNVALLSAHDNKLQHDEKIIHPSNKKESLLEVLVTPTTEYPNMPYSLLPKKKKKDKKYNLSIKR